MKVYNSSQETGLVNSVVTVGIFDGMHLGHQELLKQVIAKSLELGVPALIVTFWPHPKLYFKPDDSSFSLLMSIEERTLIMERLGVEHLLVLPFNQRMANTSAQQFIHDILVDDLSISHLILGDDHRFGRDRQGSFEFVSGLANELGFGLTRMESMLDDKTRISSTAIRDSLRLGEIEKANKLLGYPYFIIGKVVKGKQMGKKLGFPTANINCLEKRKQIPHAGVYAVKVMLKGKEHYGMLNIGTRPTVESGGSQSVEVHIFNIEEDLYGERLEVSFISRIRDEMKFDRLDQLRSQLAIDREVVLQLLSGPGPYKK